MTKETNVKNPEPVEPAGIYNLHITLAPTAYYEAIRAMEKRGLEIREHFDGPIFKDIMGYQVNGDWVAVSLKDGTTYAYPASDISRIKHYITKE